MRLRQSGAARLPALLLSLGLMACGNSGMPSQQASAEAPDAVGKMQWLRAWSAAPSNPEAVVFSRQTLRQTIHPLASGKRARLRLSNRYGQQAAAVTISRVAVGIQLQGAALVPGSNRLLTFFGGAPMAVLEVGGELLSDPFDLPVEAFRSLSVSLFVDGPWGAPTIHYKARETLWSASGDAVADETGTAYSSNDLASYWLYLGALDVLAEPPAGVLVAFGDDYSDGFVASDSTATGPVPLVDAPGSLGSNGRYPDALARRLAETPGLAGWRVHNAGISGNHLTRDAAAFYEGPRAGTRFAADVLALPSVSDVLILIGSQDIGVGVSGDVVIAALQELVAQARSAQLNVLLGTLPPSRGAFLDGAPVLHGSAAAELQRARVNQWIRSLPPGVAGIVDFELALADPANPGRLHPDYDSGDGLHPNDRGYAAMAAAVDLKLLRGKP